MNMLTIVDLVEAPVAPIRAEETTRSEATQGAAATQVQPIDTMALTSDNFPVDVTCPTRQICPKRKQVPEEWVGCFKPWTSAANTKQFVVRVLTGKRFWVVPPFVRR